MPANLYFGYKGYEQSLKRKDTPGMLFPSDLPVDTTTIWVWDNQERVEVTSTKRLEKKYTHTHTHIYTHIPEYVAKGDKILHKLISLITWK